MYQSTSLTHRLAAFVGAGSVTGVIMVGLALLAQPTMQLDSVDDPVATQPAVVVASDTDAQAERLRITVVATRRSAAAAPAQVRASADCPPQPAHASFADSPAPSAERPSKV